MDSLLISRIFQMTGWSLWAFLKHHNQIINADTCSTIRNRGKGTHEGSLRFCGESENYFFTAGFALGLCHWVRATKGEQSLCKHIAVSGTQLSVTVIWDLIHPVMCWCRLSLPVNTRVGKFVCLEWGVGDCLPSNDSAGEQSRRNSVTFLS